MNTEIKDHDLLPEYWAVKCDDSKRYKDTVGKYLTKIVAGTGFFNYDTNKFYGIRENGSYNGMFFDHNLPEECVLLTIDKFIKLISYNKSNSLPEKWAVKSDGSELFKKEIFEYVCNEGEYRWNHVVEAWYGRWNRSDAHNKNGYAAFYTSEKYSPLDDDEDVIILSIEEFIKLKNKINKKQIKIKNYEQQNIKGRTIEICRPIATITRGLTIRGNSISGKPSKITIVQRHLTNRAISI